MIYKARVIDNSMFAKTGQIRVRIFEKTHSLHANDDLSEYPETVEQFTQKVKNIFGEEKEILNDQLTYVSTPFGGGDNYGMFWLPQVNSVGIVADFGNTNNVNNNGNFIWLGGIFDYTPRKVTIAEDGSRTTEPSIVNIPSLDSYSNGASGDSMSDSVKNSFIIKTKTTELPKAEERKQQRHKMSFKKAKVKNTFIMNDSGIQLKHGENSYLNINDNSFELNSSVNNTSSVLSVNNKGYLNIKTKTYSNENTQKEISISSNEENKLILKIEGQEKGKDIYTNLTLGSEEITIENGTDKSKATIKIEGSNVSIYSDSVVNINASRVNLGNGAEHKVLTLNGRAPEGTVASETVYA